MTDIMQDLLQYLLEEKNKKQKGGLYHKTQISFAYNSNRIEGSKISEAQTRFIFETRTIGFKEEEAIPVDDIIETSNHFIAFDYILDTIDLPLSNNLIKALHKIIKNGTSDTTKKWFILGDWKNIPNEVGGVETTMPEFVEEEMVKLNEWYFNKARSLELGVGSEKLTIPNSQLTTIIEYHYRFEKIHPFQDGNGRVGRLIMFRECLKNSISPFIIDNDLKQFYIRGLKEYENVKGYLIDTCLTAQDTYKEWVRYFYRTMIS